LPSSAYAEIVRLITSCPDPACCDLDVLVVDDDPSVATSTTDILGGEGLAVACVATVDEALQIVKSRTVRSVILDHHLNGEDGDTFLAQCPNVPPVIVVSGLGRDLLAAFRVTHGHHVVASLPKPVPPRLLIEAVNAVLGSSPR